MNILPGSTNKSVYVYFVDDDGGTAPGEPHTGLLFSDIETGGSASYMRQGAARVDFTLVTLASASAAHSDGGFILVDDTNMPGLYRVDVPDAAFAAGVDFVVIQLVAAAANNCIMRPVLVDLTAPQTGDSFARLGAPAGASVSADIAVIESQTDDIGAAGAGLTAINLPDQTMNITGNITGNLSGSVGSVTGAVGSVSTGGITAASIAADAIGASELAADAVAEIADAVWDELLAGHVTADSAGELLNDWQNGGRLDLILDSRMAEASINTTGGAVDNVTLVDTTTTNTDMVAAAPTAAANADAVWDEAQADHVAAGSFGLIASEIATIDTSTAGLAGSAMRGTDNAALASVATEARLAELDAANLPADVDAVLLDTGTTIPGTITTLQADTDDIQTRLPAALVSGRMDADVGAISTSTDAADKLEESCETMLLGTVSGTPTTTTAITDISVTDDDQFKGRILIFRTATDAGLVAQATDITGCTASTNMLTFTALTVAPASGDAIIIV